MTLKFILLPLLLSYHLSLPIIADDPVVIPPLPIANDRVYGTDNHDENTESPKEDTKSTGNYREVTAYTSRVQETDDTPCIGAWGDNLCELYEERAGGDGICASNSYRKGTRLSIQGYGTCTVLDRMSKKYPNAVDIYFGYDLQRALEHGIKRLKVTQIYD